MPEVESGGGERSIGDSVMGDLSGLCSGYVTGCFLSFDYGHIWVTKLTLVDCPESATVAYHAYSHYGCHYPLTDCVRFSVRVPTLGEVWFKQQTQDGGG